MMDDPFQLKALRGEIDPKKCPWCERSIVYFRYSCDAKCFSRGVERRGRLAREEAAKILRGHGGE